MEPTEARLSVYPPVFDDYVAASSREWLVTNGIGGYASSSLTGANTRRYHALLAPALHPPLGRAVLLSKLEETLQVTLANGKETQTFALSSNIYPDTVHPDGQLLLEEWTNDPMPTWIWTPMPGIRFQKQIWMDRGKNTTYIGYRLLEAAGSSAIRLDLVPLLAWKDFHSEMHAHPGSLDAAWSSTEPAALRITLPGIWNVMARPLSLRLHAMHEDGSPFPHAWFMAHPDWYRRFQHPRERERVLDFEEDLYTPGTISALLKPGTTLVIAASTEESAVGAPQAAYRALISRQQAFTSHLPNDDDFARRLTLAADAFVVEVPGGRSSVIAGYHWFADWGRDTMISLPGLCLATGRTATARHILQSYADFVSEGMLPNRFPDRGETPEYNTVDATLWYFQAIWSYLEAAENDCELTEALWPTLQDIVAWHVKGTRYGIGVDEADGLLRAGAPGTQLTWMDAKIGDWVVTPRTGKPVEINALWYNALCIMEHLAGRIGRDGKEYGRRARTVARSFRNAFVRPDGNGLYDVIADYGPDGSVRPNQIFAVSLPHSPLIRTEQKATVDLVERELLTPRGLRTLARGDSAYRPYYGGSQLERDSAYHQGTVWAWLLGPFAEAHYRVYGHAQRARAFLQPMQDHLHEAGMGTISEIFDAEPPFRPNGCIAQAWSVAETLRVWQKLSRVQTESSKP